MHEDIPAYIYVYIVRSRYFILAYLVHNYISMGSLMCAILYIIYVGCGAHEEQERLHGFQQAARCCHGAVHPAWAGTQSTFELVHKYKH